MTSGHVSLSKNEAKQRGYANALCVGISRDRLVPLLGDSIASHEKAPT